MSNQQKTGAVRTDGPQKSGPEDANVAEVSPKAQRKADEAKNVQAAEKAATSGTGYEVAPGKSLVTPRGVIDAGEPIGPLDFVKLDSQEEEGKRRLQAMVSKKYVVRTA